MVLLCYCLAFAIAVTTQQTQTLCDSRHPHQTSLNLATPANQMSDQSDSSHHQNDDQSQNDGASSYMMEGYTPLNFDMNALAMNYGSDDSDNERHDETIDDELFSTGYYQLDANSEHKRVNGVKTHIDEFASQLQGNELSDSESSDGLVPDDFESLAEQALRGLEEEHRVVLERSDHEVNAQSQSSENNIAEYNVAEHKSLSGIYSSHNVDSMDEKRNQDISMFETNFDEMMELPTQTESQTPAAPKKFPAARMTTSKTNKPGSKKESNLKSIQEAMKSIRKSAPDFASTLDARSSTTTTASAYKAAADASYSNIINSTCQAIKERQNAMHQSPELLSHPIIPSGPLAAFRRNTPKARSAAHNLSRSATLSEAVFRLWPLICFRKKLSALSESEWLSGREQGKLKQSNHLIIHIIGSDGVECSSEESVRNSVGAFVRWLDASFKSGVLSDSFNSELAHDEGIRLMIEFSGPNMPESMTGKSIDLLPNTAACPSLTGLVSASCILRRCEYNVSSQTATNCVADLTVAFNAGIW